MLDLNRLKGNEFSICKMNIGIAVLSGFRRRQGNLANLLYHVVEWPEKLVNLYNSEIALMRDKGCSEGGWVNCVTFNPVSTMITITTTKNQQS